MGRCHFTENTGMASLRANGTLPFYPKSKDRTASGKCPASYPFKPHKKDVPLVLLPLVRLFPLLTLPY
ncbi:MAG: hypothetical protein K0Q87_313 [Neobacillus sp.]|jgi:hypothetical protein|nr:hypothetical protein [Neobacillus sp.]